MKLNPYVMCRCHRCKGRWHTVKRWRKQEVHRRFRRKDKQRIMGGDYDVIREVALINA